MKEEDKKIKWYLRPITVAIAILFVGPLALPLVWRSPAFKKIHKIILTVALIIITIWLIGATVRLYKILLEDIKTLQETLM